MQSLPGSSAEGSKGGDPEWLQAGAFLSQSSKQTAGRPESSEKTLAAKVWSPTPACLPSPRVALGRAGALQSHPWEIHDHVQWEDRTSLEVTLQAFPAAGMGLLPGLVTKIPHAMLHGQKNKGMDNSFYNKHMLIFKKETVFLKNVQTEWKPIMSPSFSAWEGGREMCVTLSNISCLCAEIPWFPGL